MFNLDKRIEEWRDELLASQPITENDVNELVSHLEDNVDELIKTGLFEEEAYWVARHRLGDAQALCVEFSKVNRVLIWRKRIMTLLLGYFLFTSIPILVKFATIPMYLLNTEWLFVENPLFGPNFPMPLPLFLLILAVIGGVLVLAMSEKSVFQKSDSYFLKHFPRFKLDYKFIGATMGLYLMVTLGNVFSQIYIAREYSSVVMGTIAASTLMFTVLWNIFLFASLAVLLFSLQKTKKTA